MASGKEAQASHCGPADGPLSEAVGLEAVHAADLLIDTLEARGLIPPEKTRLRQGSTELYAAGALRAAAALRRCEWKDHGLVEFVLEEPPERDIDPRLDDIFRTHRPSEAVQSIRYAQRTLRTWIENFSWSARGALDVDVVLGGPDVLGAEGLDWLAEFVWRHRHAGSNLEGEDDAST
jgi:hypothetical protein